MIDLALKTLTAEAFSPFGEVLETDPAKSYLINNGSTRRFHDLAEVDAGEGGVPIISIFRGVQCATPAEIRMLERHPLATQAFYPLSAHPWLVVVAEGEAPAAADCRAFLARGDQGVQLAPGTWHHPSAGSRCRFRISWWWTAKARARISKNDSLPARPAEFRSRDGAGSISGRRLPICRRRES